MSGVPLTATEKAGLAPGSTDCATGCVTITTFSDSVMLTERVVLAVAPSSSVTVSVITCSPGPWKVKLAVAPLALPTPAKSQA